MAILSTCNSGIFSVFCAKLKKKETAAILYIDKLPQNLAEYIIWYTLLIQIIKIPNFPIVSLLFVYYLSIFCPNFDSFIGTKGWMTGKFYTKFWTKGYYPAIGESGTEQLMWNRFMAFLVKALFRVQYNNGLRSCSGKSQVVANLHLISFMFWLPYFEKGSSFWEKIFFAINQKAIKL